MKTKLAILVGLFLCFTSVQADAPPDGVYGGIWFPQKPDFAGYIRVKHNGVDLYIPAYFSLTPDQVPIGPMGPTR